LRRAGRKPATHAYDAMIAAFVEEPRAGPRRAPRWLWPSRRRRQVI